MVFLQVGRPVRGLAFAIGGSGLAAAGSVVGHKMSMLRDLERGRSLEIDVLVTVVMELGLWTHVPTPVVNAVLPLAQERGRAAGLYTPVGSSR